MREQPRKPQPDQVTEWFEGPVTAYFFYLVKELEKKANMDLQSQGYDPDSLSMRGYLWGLRDSLVEVGESYKSQLFIELEEVEDGESVGDIPESG